MADMESIIADTIEVLQPLIKKPKLTPKLLGKPPFRFLHDVVSGVADSTGFGQGLYGPDEMNAAGIKDKEAKLAYLEKIHLYVCAAVGQDVPLKLGKVVAGMEADKTNEFLQALATAATDGGVNRQAALASVLGGDAGEDDGDDGAAEAAAAEEASRAQAQRAAQEEQRRAQQEQARQQAEARRQEEEEMAAAQAAQQETEQDQGDDEPQMPPPAAPPSMPQGGGSFGGEEEPDMPPPPQMERRAMPQRPTTARRPPPKLPSKEVKMERKERPNIPKPGQPDVPVAAVVGVLTEGADDEEEEEEEVVAAPLPGWDLGEKDGDEVVEGEQHGALVADIMNEKKKLAGDGASQAAAEESAPAGGGIIIKKKNRAISSASGSKRPAKSDNDINKLRISIQQLCQSTTPLGKCIEGVQGDLDHMEREFRQWKAESQVNSRKLEQTSNNTEANLQPLQAQINEEEGKVREMKQMIDRIKANIMQNNLTIHSLLRGVVAGHRN